MFSHGKKENKAGERKDLMQIAMAMNGIGK